MRTCVEPQHHTTPLTDEAIAAMDAGELRRTLRHVSRRVLTLEDQLRQAQKIEPIGQLAGGVAHDFNNLLMVILGYCETIALSFEPDHPIMGQVQEIRKAGERATALTQQLLAFTRRQRSEPKIVDLNWIVADIDRMLRRLIGENIALKMKLASELGRVVADPSHIQQILLNMVVNARDAMPQGGVVTIETANVRLDATHLRMVGSRLAPGAYVMLAVADTGVGMDEATKARIFEPFFTTKGQQGTGLGLATVSAVVREAGGEVLVESQPGQGSTFRVYLPQTDAPADASQPAGAELLSGHERVLVVEDEAPVRSLVTAMLRRQGYDVLEAGSGEEALAVEEQDRRDIDLLLTDVIMPGMSGSDLAERMQELRPRMKVLFISGHVDHLTLQRSGAHPGAAFLPKPFAPAVLGRKVRQVLDGAAAG